MISLNTTDGSGIINYLSERRVIDGDGLVNNYEFKRVVESRQLAEYLVSTRVDIVIANLGPDAATLPRIRIPSAGWNGMRSYVYAVADRSKALADFCATGVFCFMPFRIADLQFTHVARSAEAR